MSKFQSPWVTVEETPRERAMRMAQEGKTPDKRTHEVEGYLYTLRVVVSTYESDPAVLGDYALHMFGACLKQAQAFKDFDSALETRNVSRDPKKVLGAKVKITLSETTYYAKASSHDLKTAMTHAIDRMAAALSELAVAHPPVAKALQDSGLTLIRKV